MSIWQDWTTNNKYKKLNKTKKINMNTKTTGQKIFTMRILIRNNWIGYYKILKETKFSIRRKTRRMMKIQKKKITLRI